MVYVYKILSLLINLGYCLPNYYTDSRINSFLLPSFRFENEEVMLVHIAHNTETYEFDSSRQKWRRLPTIPSGFGYRTLRFFSQGKGSFVFVYPSGISCKLGDITYSKPITTLYLSIGYKIDTYEDNMFIPAEVIDVYEQYNFTIGHLRYLQNQTKISSEFLFDQRSNFLPEVKGIQYTIREYVSLEAPRLLITLF